MASLSIRDVYKTYPNGVPVLKGVNIDIEDGQFLILVGGSGCGKSTLLNMIAGLETVTKGEIQIDGKTVNNLSPKDRDIAMVFQSYALYPSMTVRENISFGLNIRKVPKQEQTQIVDRVSNTLQITHLLDRKPGQLSGGQRQRVAMGRALARDPVMFLFDEPLSNLDAKLRIEMRSEIKLLHQRLGTTIVYVTHDQIEAMTLADRIAIMKNGIIQQLDTPHAVYNHPVNLFVAGFIGSPTMNFLKGNINGTSFATETLNVPLGGYKFEKGAGGKVDGILGVRPEHIAVGEDAKKMPFQLESEIEIVEPMGSETVAWTKVDGQSVTFRCSSDIPLEPGQKVMIGFDPARGSLFDAQSGARV